ncbi:MAG TPA: hypothetical protein DCE44_10205 [Verrucomicrobiales bacterium]|nr:hypothetical protein [Verrucomicrobiales bacterium]
MLRWLFRSAGLLAFVGLTLAQSGDGAMIRRLSVASSEKGVGFSLVPAGTAGIWLTNQVLPERYLTNQIFLNGSGVALGDVNGDGRPDLFFGAAAGGSELFLNLGHWRFTNITRQAFSSIPTLTSLGGLDVCGAVLADLDGDNNLDLAFTTVGAGTHILFNDGQGLFAARRPPLNIGHAGTSLAFADVDGDGDLDLYVANYRTSTIRDDPTGKFTVRDQDGRPRVVAYNGRPTTEPDLVGRFLVTPAGVKENGEPDAFFLNDGKGGFSPVDWTGGVFRTDNGETLAAPPYDWGLSVLFRDLNGDGRPDLFVCNDFESPDRFWLNETPPGGPPRFRSAPMRTLRHTSAFSMGADAADVNRDGVDDFLVLDMLSRNHQERNFQVDSLPPSRHEPGNPDDRPQFSENTLFLGRGDGTFSELGRFAGLAASEWSWSPIFLDVDLDGYEDLLVSNGHELDMMDADVNQQAEELKRQRRMSPRELLELRRKFRRFDAPDAAFRNQGNLAFADESAAWGLSTRNVTHGMALADLDGDGDLDVVQNNLNAPPTLLRNDTGAPRIAVRARALGANTRGIGARLRVLGGAVREQSQVLMTGGRYLSSDDPMRVFAAGDSTQLSLEVRWPSGNLSVVSNLPPNSLIEVTEASGLPPAPPLPDRPIPLFTDVSSQLGHRSTDTPFYDLDRQPLLPWSVAYPAPGATWADLDGIAPDELIIGTGAGGTPAVFQWRDNAFTRFTNAPLQRPVLRDLTTVLAVGQTLLAGSSNYRDGRTNGGALRIYDLARGTAGESLAGRAANVGPLALADVDGDGELDIFLGGRAVAGRYPEAAPSLLLKSNQGRFSVARSFETLGLVNSVTFADFDGDGDPDLLVATEWGPLRLLRNARGNLASWNAAVHGPEGHTETLQDLSGWWTSVAVGDFDADGRLDFVAGNRGWNWFPTPRAPLASSEPDPAQRRRLRFGDFDHNGSVEILESYFVGDRELPVRRAEVLFAAFPGLREKFSTRAAFGSASLGEVVAALALPTPPSLVEADWFSSAVFLNRGEYFERRALPREAQFAPVTGLAVADFDGDGRTDIFLAQNFFPVRPDEARQDAGRGLLLRGDGRGEFAPERAESSGIEVWDDARAAAVGDFNLDGRPDLVVTQNAGPTRLFANSRGQPGLQVRLLGPPENPTGVGTQLRLRTTGESGPLQEVQAGSGWLSVDSPGRVVTASAARTGLEIRWPGATAVIVPVPPKAKVITVNPVGVVSVLR